jgi:hypothetical protein
LKAGLEDCLIGYIIRDETSAKINIAEADKIMEYAMLNSQMIETAEIIGKLFGQSKIDNVLVEGKKVKANCKIDGENKTCVFLNKNAKPSTSAKSRV